MIELWCDPRGNKALPFVYFNIITYDAVHPPTQRRVQTAHYVIVLQPFSPFFLKGGGG